MVEAAGTKTKVMPKGIRKGGARYPRYTLPECLAWAKKLVSKTHLGPQPAAIVMAGVVGSTTTPGEIRISALKQYGLMEGKSSAYTASGLAKKIASSPDNELAGLYRQAALSPIVFKGLFDTFHGDSVSKAKLKQRAADLNVHPEETEKCVSIYIASTELAGLTKVDGDQVTHQIATEATSTAANLTAEERPNDEAGRVSGDAAEESAPEDEEIRVPSSSLAKAIFNVNITIDSSMDVEKLQKQLELLKKFGAI